MKKDVFISYSGDDKSTAFEIVDYLEGKGIECFIAPRDIDGGISYGARLTAAIRECRAVILVAGKAILTSEHVLNELDIIVGEKKFFVPFFIEDFELSSEYRYYLGRKQRIMAHVGSPRDHFSKLLDTIASEIGYVDKPEPKREELRPARADNTKKEFDYIPHRGIMINPEDQQRNVSFRTDTFISLMSSIYKEVADLSDEEHAGLVFHKSGYSAGQSFAQRLNSRWDLAADSLSLYSEKLHKWCEFDSDVGWGKFDIDVDVNEETGDFHGTLTINECFIVDMKNKCRICEFVKGYCEGVIETLLGANVSLICRTCPLKNRFKTTCVFDIIIND